MVEIIMAPLILRKKALNYFEETKAIDVLKHTWASDA
jgi:hypothetical protein